MEQFAPSDIWKAFLVIVAICAAIATIAKAVEVIRNFKKPVANVENCLANDKRRLDKHDSDIAELKTGVENLSSGVLALLEHELHNGNSDEMERASAELKQWLIRRK